MIKKYIQFIKESLLNKIEGPTEEDIKKYLDGLNGFELMKKSIKVGYLPGVIRGMTDYEYIDDVLLLSLQYDFLEGVIYALEHNADKNLKININDHQLSIDEVNILGYCVYYEKKEILNYLLDNNIFSKNDMIGAKNVAIVTNNMDILDTPLDPINIFLRSSAYTTSNNSNKSNLVFELNQPIQAYNNMDILDTFLNKGIKLNEQDLIWCASENNIEMIDYIIEKGFISKVGINNIIKIIIDNGYTDEEIIEHIENKLNRYESK